MTTDRTNHELLLRSLKEMHDAPRIFVWKDSEGTPDLDGLNKALKAAGIPSLWAGGGFPQEARPPHPVLSEFLELLPQFGFMSARVEAFL